MTPVQRELAEKSRFEIAARSHEKILTAIEPAGTFYPAEDYHQKHLLRLASSIFQDLRITYPDEKEFIASTAAARINGYLGCNGDPAKLQSELDDLGLSPAMEQRLIKYISSSCKNFSGLSCPAPR